MAEIFGAVAAGIALCTQLTQFGIAIHKATKDIKNSRRDIVKLADETILFASSSEDFLRSCADDHQAKSSATCSIRPLTIWIRKTKKGLFKLLQNVEALRSDPKNRPSLQKVLIAYLTWYFSKKEVKCLRVSLKIAGASMIGYSNLICIRKLEEELQLLKRALKNAASRQEVEEKFGMTIENKIKLVKEAINIKTTVHHTNKRIMRDSADELELKQQGLRTSDFVSAPPDDLFDFTDSLRRFSQDIMPSVPLKQSPFAAYQSSSSSSSSIEQRGATKWPRAKHFPVVATKQLPQTPSARRSPRTSTSNSMPTNSSSESSIRSSAVALGHASRTTYSTASSSLAQPSTGIIRAPSSGDSGEARATKFGEEQHDADIDVSCPPSMRHLNDANPRKSARVGRYSMILDAHHLRIHDQILTVKDYAVGDAFFQALLYHEDQVDAVIEALSSRDLGFSVFGGIPGWLVDGSGIHAQAGALDPRDI